MFEAGDDEQPRADAHELERAGTLGQFGRCANYFHTPTPCEVCQAATRDAIRVMICRPDLAAVLAERSPHKRSAAGIAADGETEDPGRSYADIELRYVVSCCQRHHPDGARLQIARKVIAEAGLATTWMPFDEAVKLISGVSPIAYCRKCGRPTRGRLMFERCDTGRAGVWVLCEDHQSDSEDLLAEIQGEELVGELRWPWDEGRRQWSND